MDGASNKAREWTERVALPSEDNKIMPIAKTAARAVFLLCGGNENCKSWTMISGGVRKLAHVVMEAYLAEHPGASAEALYDYLMNYPAGAMEPPDERAGRIFAKAPTRWADAPPPVRAAYRVFCGVYRELWREIRALDDGHGADR